MPLMDQLSNLRQYLLTGVSFTIPLIACGGILIAASIGTGTLMGAPMAESGPDLSEFPVLTLMLDIGVAAFGLMLPVLAGYIAYAIAGKPGLAPGFIGGFLCDRIPAPADAGVSFVSAGFLGAIFAGLIAGFVVQWMKKLPVPRSIRPIMPILIMPITGGLIVGVLILKVIGLPIAGFMDWMSAELASMQSGNAVVLALVLGAMIAFDMGGPVNKTAFFFGAAMITKGNYLIMGACAAAICTPPLGIGLATLLFRKYWTEEERDSGGAALAMGTIGITEGAIPFAAADPLRVIPCLMFGSMVAAVIAMLGGVGDHAPHGGPIVLPVIDNKIAFIIAIIMGTLLTAFSVILVKRFTGGVPAHND